MISVRHWARLCVRHRSSAAVAPRRARATPPPPVPSAKPMPLPAIEQLDRQPVVLVPQRRVKASVCATADVAAPRSIVSLDFGTKNFAFCVLSGKTGQIKAWERLDLDAEGVNTANIEETVQFFERFKAQHIHLFPSTAHVVMENQVSTRLRVMQAITFTFFQLSHVTRVISPRRLRAHFGIGTGEYRKNKQASVELCRIMLGLRKRDDKWLKQFESETKKDDLADCYLQAMFWRDESLARAAARA